MITIPSKQEVDLGRATGLRREEALGLKPEDIFEENGKVYVKIASAMGGKTRDIPVLDSYRERILELRDQREGYDLLIEKPSELTPYDKMRQDYSQAYYSQIEAEHNCINPDREKDFYIEDGRVFERDILINVFKALGLNTAKFVAKNYLE